MSSTPPTTTTSSSSMAAFATTTTASARAAIATVNGVANVHGSRAAFRHDELQCRRSSTSRCRTPASMRPMRRRRTRSAPNSTAPVRQYGGWRRSQRQSKPDLRARAEQGDRGRHQVGAVRQAPAGDRRAVPDREGQRARVAEHHSAARDATCPYPRRPERYPVSRGAAYRIRGIDLGVGGKITDKWSIFGGLVLMESEVTKSLIVAATAALCPTQCRPAARQHRAPVVQPADQVSGHRCLGARRAGGLPVEDLWRHLPRRQPGHVIPSTGVSMPSPKHKIDKNWKASCS